MKSENLLKPQNISIIDSQSISFTSRLFATNLYVTNDQYKVQDALCSFSKIHYLVEGQLKVTINDTEMILYPGDFLLIPANTRHSVSLINSKKCLFYFADVSLHFNINEISGVLDLPYFVHLGLNQEIIETFENLRTTLSDNYNHISSIKQANILSRLLLLFIDNCGNQPQMGKNPVQDDAVYATIEYIKSHFHEKLTVPQLAQMACICSNYYTSRFKQITGMSPIQFVNSLRIKKAQELLETSELTLKEISDSINYCDPVQFCKAFKKHTGYTPTEYRKLANLSTSLVNGLIDQIDYSNKMSETNTNKN